MTPRQIAPDDPDLLAILALIQRAFAPMEGRVNPPSSIHCLTLAALRSHAQAGEVWALGQPPVAAVIATRDDDALYLGKLAVAPARRKQGLARQLFAAIERHARALGLSKLRLQTRIELTENHTTFAALGFTETGRAAHPGFAQPTSLTFERALSRTTDAP